MKWYIYIICVIVCIFGVFSGFGLYQKIKSKSYVNGDINIENKFSMESFNYTSSSVEFYENMYDKDSTYSFSNDLLKIDNFDGIKNIYKVTLNKYELLDVIFNAGSVFAVFNMDFYDLENNVICSATLNISILFYSDKTNLKLATKTFEEASFFSKYFKNNGIRLKVNQIF